MGTSDRISGTLRRSSLISAAVSILIGITVLAGWVIDVPVLRSFWPDSASMKVLAAAALIMGGFALIFILNGARSHMRKLLTVALAAVVYALGFLNLLEYIFDADIGIDQALFKDIVSPSYVLHPGRMILTAAIAFMLIGIALMLIALNRRINVAQVLAMGAFGLGFLSMLAYLYQLDSTIDLTMYTMMPVSMTFACMILSGGLLFARPDQGLMAIVSDDGFGGAMLRRVIPPAVIIPVVIGWLWILGEKTGLYASGHAASFEVFSAVAILAIVIWFSSVSLKKADDSRRKVEAELKVQKEIAEAATQAKSDFLANMSHEIRTPITGVNGMINLAMQTELTEQQRKYLELAKSSSETLVSLVGDILDYSKIEARKVELERVQFDVADVVSESCSIIGVEARSKELALTYSIEPGVQTRAVGDPARLRQVLFNLLKNAIKFTEKGSVTLTVKADDCEAGQTKLHFTVADTGIGIPKDTIGGLFTKFTQADSSITRKYGGSGLGLAICKGIVELMGGSIWVESEVGKGSAFHFTATFGLAGSGECASPKAVESPAVQPGALAGVKVLLVEDNHVNRMYALALLEKTGAEAKWAANGADAIAAMKEGGVDVVLMDIQMPDMDGMEATMMIRALEAERGKRTPIIALTAHALKGDKERFLAAGMDGYLSKPFEAAALYDRIAAVAGPPTVPAAPAKTPKTNAPTEGIEYLDVEDFLGRVGGDAKLVDELLGVYLEEARSELGILKESLKANDAEGAELHAHTLKGMSANVSANAVSAAAKDANEAVKAGDMEKARGLIKPIEDTLIITEGIIVKRLDGAKKAEGKT